jgi:Tfp pilus assembly protein PilO
MFSEADKKILQTALVGGVVAILGLFYYMWAVVNPEMASRDKDITSHTDLIKKKDAELAEIKRWEGRTAEIAAIIQQLDQKIKRLPGTSDASEFLRILRECVQITNLSDIRIGRVKNVPMGAYDEIPFMVTCRARYHDLGQFLTLVEQHPQRIMRVKTLNVTSDLARPSRHTAIVQVATFVFNESVPRAKEVASK